MSRKWTDAQLCAITQKNKTLLLSAAAGSGKTSTLTERIIRSITEDGADISRMLIVTFTRASAQDLKIKISAAINEALSKDPFNTHLTSQLIKLGSANISTIDAFYVSTVRQGFAELGLSSSFRIADSSETDLIAKSVMRDVVNNYYDHNSEFPALCECFEALKSTEDVIEEVLLSLYDSCMHTPSGVAYINECADELLSYKDTDFLQTSFGKIILDHTRTVFESFLEKFEEILPQIQLDEHVFAAYYDTLNDDRIKCIKALNVLDGKSEECSYEQLMLLLSSFEFPTIPSLKSQYVTDTSVFCRNLRDGFKAALKALKNKYFSYSAADMPKYIELTCKNLELLYSVLADFEKEYVSEKLERNILELTDVKRKALELFVNPDGSFTKTAEQYSKQYDAIYIDEYQDVDPVQDLIFRSISTPTNRFMVGDIKQSIYSFRGAEPSLFADYRKSFPTISESSTESLCATIFMSENFRCSQPVIDFTNAVCSNLFSICKDSIGYTSDDDLKFSKVTDGALLPPSNVKIAVFAKSPKKKDAPPECDALISPAVAEARYIANEIYTLIKNGKKENGKSINPGDIAVLFRNKSTSIRIKSELSRLGIKSTVSDSTQYFQNPDVLMTLCILNAIDNPHRDIQLAGAMRSPIFNFTLEDMLLISALGDSSYSLYDKLLVACEGGDELAEKCKVCHEKLSSWKSISLSLPVDKFLRLLFSDSAFMATGLVSERNKNGEGGHLMRLYEYARTFEAGSYKGLYNFIEFINTVIENGKTLENKNENSASDCVTLTTIHKSKGLEFPVCFVADLSRDFGGKEQKLSFEYGAGIAMELSDETGFATYTSPIKDALDLLSKNKAIEEEMRILYVALTRARERLYLTASSSRKLITTIETDASFSARFNKKYSCISQSSYLNWILSALQISSNLSCYELNLYGTDDFSTLFSDEKLLTAACEEDDACVDCELVESLKQVFSFKYAHAALQRIPAKLSVSKLSPDVLDETDTSLKIYEKSKQESIPPFFTNQVNRATASDRGTATHLFLQFCDFDYAKAHGIEAMKNVLVEKKFITEEIASQIFVRELELFLESELFELISKAKKVIREQRFNVTIPCEFLTQDNTLRADLRGEKIAVQGVIDLILIDGDGNVSLYDYKTDRLSSNELLHTDLASAKLNTAHSKQLSYYAHAINQLFGKEPQRICVYSTAAGRLFDIKTVPLEILQEIL